MAEVTTSSMHDARDAEDTRLLEAGEYQPPLEGYYGVILDRCRLKVRGARTRERCRARGRRPAPRRAQARPALPRALPRRRPQGDRVEGQGALPGDAHEVELEDWLRGASTESDDELEADARLRGAARRPDRARAARCSASATASDLDFQEIARRLGKEPNAVHQIHYRALAKLRKEAA